MFGEGPGCVSLAETIVRLVKEGQMEEPNEKMFKTPRKVSHAYKYHQLKSNSCLGARLWQNIRAKHRGCENQASQACTCARGEGGGDNEGGGVC